ncbi:Y-family DNA polymerase, partial [Rhodosalinus sp.]|uniref:Y-family DNA polymerase n=1 Tax=Rhodosalinus sp. TaxID=2047741 RepID=UPI0039788C14
MPARRILSIWFPRLAAERLLRLGAAEADAPFAVVRDERQRQVVAALSAAAEAAGIARGQPLADAMAVCPDLVTRRASPPAEAAFLSALRRWAGRVSPWVAEAPPDGLVADITGCAHLFGGEAALVDRLAEDCAGFGLTMRCAIADTQGAAWALARYAGGGPVPTRSGDAIEQEARATRSKAARRRRESGGTLKNGGRIAPPGQTRSALAPLPVAALRIEPDVAEQLARLGLRAIGDLTGQPRAALARRFGPGLVARLDQALGAAPEPVSPAPPPRTFAARLSLPDPIGLEADIMAGLDRLMDRVCARLREAGRGARRLRLEAHRSDHATEVVEVGLARASDDPDRIRPVLALKVGGIDAGFGIDMLRLEAVQTEPLTPRRPAGHLDASERAMRTPAPEDAVADLIGRMGARIGLEAITRRHPADSHIPEKTATTLAAAWSEPCREAWPRPPAPRPLLLWRPEPVGAPDDPAPPARFRWRGRDLSVAAAEGPERIAPEWWLDDPDWRTGQRDYWRVTCAEGDRLWLYYAHGAAMSPGWFCHGAFA